MAHTKNTNINRLEQLFDLLRRYNLITAFDKAQSLRDEINEVRLNLAIQSLKRNIYIQELPIDTNVNSEQSNYFFSRRDTPFTIVKAISSLFQNQKISFLHQGDRRRVLINEFSNWNNLFAEVSGQPIAAITGNQIPFNFEQELFFSRNQTLQVTVNGLAPLGRIYFHGADVNIDKPINTDNLVKEIESTLPEWTALPLTFLFSSALNVLATNLQGDTDILTPVLDRSLLLTHCATTADYSLTLSDIGRNQEICHQIDVLGMASSYIPQQYTAWMPLPYPHLLQAGSQLKIEARSNGLFAGSPVIANTPVYLIFKGFKI